MKTTFLIIIFFLTLNCKAQDNYIHSNEIKINGAKILGKDISTIFPIIGNYLNVKDFYFEMDNLNGKEYKFNGITVYTLNNNIIDSFEISGSNISFNNIHVGDNINSLKDTFPLSYSNKSFDEMTILIKDIDKYIVIKYNLNNLITLISIQNF